MFGLKAPIDVDCGASPLQYTRNNNSIAPASICAYTFVCKLHSFKNVTILQHIIFDNEEREGGGEFHVIRELSMHTRY